MTTVNPVLMPLVQRVMPNIIAQQIIGVQPMTGLSGQIFRAGTKHILTQKKRQMNKEHYKVFLRLNDRKKSQKREDFYRAGYPWVDVDLNKNWQEMHKWCRDNFGENGYLWFGERFFFENENDRLLFILAGWAQ